MKQPTSPKQDKGIFLDKRVLRLLFLTIIGLLSTNLSFSQNSGPVSTRLGLAWDGVSNNFGLIGKAAADGVWSAGAAFISFNDQISNNNNNIMRRGTNIDFYTHRYNAGTNLTMSLTGYGNVGIGTLTPREKLDVNGIVNATGFTRNGQPLGSNWNSSFYSNNIQNITYNAGMVGIGVDSTRLIPNTVFQVFGHSKLAGHVSVGQPWHITANHSNNIGKPDANNEWRNGAAFLRFIDDHNDDTSNVRKGTSIDFYTHDLGVETKRSMTITANGNVGIGVERPVEKLDVNGTVNATGFKLNQHSIPWRMTPDKDNSRNNLTFLTHPTTADNDGGFMVIHTEDEAPAIGNQLGDHYNLFVTQGIVTPDYAITLVDKWEEDIPDYVFEEAYKLTPLAEVEAYVKKHKHLPNVAGINDMKANHNMYSVGDMLMGQLKNLEEQVLHTIAQHKEIETLKKENKELHARLDRLEKLIMKGSTNK